MFLLKKKKFVDDFLYISDSDLNSESDQEDDHQTNDPKINSESDQEDNYQTNDQMPDFLNNQSYFYDINIPSLNTIYFDSNYILLGTGVILSSIFILKALKKK